MVRRKATPQGERDYRGGGEMKDKFIPDFYSVVQRSIKGKGVEWIDPVNKSLMRGKVEELLYVVLTGPVDAENPLESAHRPNNPYHLGIRGEDGYHYSMSVECVLFVE